jgi:hypothetical protein
MTRITIGKYIWGMVASLIILLAGGWLILAPFALGYQAYGADWVSQTTNDFWVGIPVAVVALVSFALFFAALVAALRTSGVLLAQPRPQQFVAPVSSPMQTPAALVPAANTGQSDLDRTLATLAAALAADLNNRRQAQTGSDQQSDQTISNRREI